MIPSQRNRNSRGLLPYPLLFMCRWFSISESSRNDGLCIYYLTIKFRLSVTINDKLLLQNTKFGSRRKRLAVRFDCSDSKLIKTDQNRQEGSHFFLKDVYLMLLSIKVPCIRFLIEFWFGHV